MRRTADALLLGAIVAAGAVLRFAGLAEPSLWLDEILDYDVATKVTHEPFWHWLTGFASEHGPFFFATELAGRVASTPELAARFAPAIFGVAAIAVAGIAGRGVGSGGSGVGAETPDAAAAEPRFPAHGTALAFALLLAGSPLAIYYSREARPYALLMLLSASMLALLLRAAAAPRETPSRTRIPSLLQTGFVLLALMLFATSGATPLLIAIAITAGIAFLFDRRRFFAWLAFAAVVAAALVPLLYRRRAGASSAAGFRPLTARFFERLLQSFSVAAIDVATVHRAAYVVAALALIGAVALVRRDRVRGAIVIGMALFPIAVSLTALWRLRHWYAVRYIATALPAYLLLVAIGIVAILQLILRGRSAVIVPVVALVAVALIVREGWQAARTEPYRN
jgi:uncharacterized membrane protein